MKKNSTNLMRHALLILVPLLSVGALLPQESPTLAAKAVVPLTGALASLGPLMEPSRCDPDGDVYLRVCYSPNEFTFVGRDKEHPPAIVEAIPR